MISEELQTRAWNHATTFIASIATTWVLVMLGVLWVCFVEIVTGK